MRKCLFVWHVTRIYDLDGILSYAVYVLERNTEHVELISVRMNIAETRKVSLIKNTTNINLTFI